MEEEKITITTKEYRALLEAFMRIKIFSDYVKKEKYIERKECARYLGFEIENDKED